jgi:AraC family L-rhamnose operon regulatory protein RhaS
MKLCTECHWDGWDRIVDIYPERSDKLPEYINDPDNYKIIILEKGTLEIKSGGRTRTVKAPALIGLSQKDVLDYKIIQSIKACILFFKPTVIRDEFTYERIDSGEFDKAWGTSIFQDYVLIRSVALSTNVCDHVLELPLNGLKRLKELYTSAEKELHGQKDGYWPCRSRSYLMELLYYIVYTFIEVAPDDEESPEQEEFSKITEYLNEHIDEQITVETITKKFAINRNKLNDIFMKQASMTCHDYLLNLRLDLAKVMLTNTELPINEIGSRVGYPDANYFTKLFKNVTGRTPTQYRGK